MIFAAGKGFDSILKARVRRDETKAVRDVAEVRLREGFPGMDVDREAMVNGTRVDLALVEGGCIAVAFVVRRARSLREDGEERKVKQMWRVERQRRLLGVEPILIRGMGEAERIVPVACAALRRGHLLEEGRP